MRIPSKLKTCRYYVAESVSKAYSSWGTALEAEAAVGRFYLYEPNINVHGIIVVNEYGKWWHIKKLKTVGFGVRTYE